jgi:carbamoyltransferase
MNIKAMMEVAKMDEVQEMFVPGNGADESNAIGACYLVHAKNCQDSGIAPNSIPLNRDLYLGPSYSRDDVKVAIENHRDKSFKMKEDVLPEEVAKIISGGDPVARFSGKMEFGARALGNRSILADPRNINIVRKINNQIKCRDFWMPFAPVILKERADDYLLNHKNIESPFMTIGFETTPLAQKDLIASLHQGDLTARPQILTEEVNPGYYKLIKEFEVLTGVGGLVNTSFNLHGEPIVNTPEDALHVFFNSGLDYLVLEDVLIYKETESH